MSEWPSSSLLPSSTSASQDATSSSGPAFSSVTTNGDALATLLQQLASVGTIGQQTASQQQQQLPLTSGLTPNLQPNSSLIEQILASSAASNFPQQDQLITSQIQMPVTTTADMNNKNLQLLATLAALRVEEQNNQQLLANLEATTSAQLAVTTQQTTLASSLPTFVTSSFGLEQPTVSSTTAPSSSLQSTLMFLAALQQQQQQQGFCANNELARLAQQQQQIPTLPTQQTSTLDLLRQLQAINSQQLLSPTGLIGTSSGTAFQTTNAALTQKPIITTVVPPQQTQPIPVKRGRPRRLTEGAQSFSLMQRPQKIAETKAVDALSIATKPAGFVRPSGRVPTSSDSCSAIANFLMSYNKASFLKMSL